MTLHSGRHAQLMPLAVVVIAQPFKRNVTIARGINMYNDARLLFDIPF